jgi:rSAM/selenodomain-associated transferase 1
MNCERRSKPQGKAFFGIFVRFPNPGKVKTRLAAVIGDKPAAEFYRLCAEHVFKESSKLSHKVRRYIFFTDNKEIHKIRRWVGPRFHFVPQAEGELGQRLEHAFSIMFSHGAQKAIVSASDVPDLSTSLIDDAMRALDTCDMVIGPSEDGGYYLIGTKKMHCELFDGIPWSTERVLSQTMGIAEALGLAVCMLPSLADIDTAADLRRWAKTGACYPIQDFIRSVGANPGI